MAQLLVNVLSVGPLAPGASVTIAHNLESNGASVAPTLVFPDRATTIEVTATTSTTVTFTNNGPGVASANFRCERGWQPEVDAFTVTPMRWSGVSAVSTFSGYGQFSDTTDQALAANTPRVVTFNTTDAAVGVALVAGSQLTVTNAGTYRFDISFQMLHTGGGTVNITFWPSINGVNVPNSASSIEMGNNNNRTLPYVAVVLTLGAGQYVEWNILSTGPNTSVEHFAAVVGPPAVPAIPSVIAGVLRIA